MTQSGLIGGIEAGGTKFVLAVGSSPTAIRARHVIPTETPETTLAAALAWFREQGPLDALGIASFGPVDLDPASATWGHITNTPKPGWAQCDVAGYFARALNIPVGFDTDVNGAALAEATHGAGLDARQGAGSELGSLAYITVGTGIGGGLVINGKPVHGIAHPEMGHVFPRRAANDADFAGVCPHHGDCLEGLASGPAIAARWGAPLSQLAADHAAHDRVADYVAQLVYSLFATAAPNAVVLGGGVMQTPGLLERIETRVRALDNGYLPGGAGHRICAPGLGDDAGVVGAMMLAASA